MKQTFLILVLIIITFHNTDAKTGVVRVGVGAGFLTAGICLNICSYLLTQTHTYNEEKLFPNGTTNWGKTGADCILGLSLIIGVSFEVASIPIAIKGFRQLKVSSNIVKNNVGITFLLE